MVLASMTLSSALVTGRLMPSRHCLAGHLGRTPGRNSLQRLQLLAASQAHRDSPVPKLEPSAEAGTPASQAKRASTAGKSKRKARAPKAVDGASDVTVDEAGPPAKQAAKKPRATTTRSKSTTTKAAAGATETKAAAGGTAKTRAAAGGTAKTKAAAGTSKRKPRATKAAATAVAETSAEQAAAGSQAQPKAAAETLPGAIDELVSRQRAARKFITPWLTAKAASREDAAARIADDSEVDTDDSEEGTSNLEETVAAPTASATSKEAAPAEDSSQSKFSPTETLEDGSMMFSTEALSTMSFEEILTP